MLLQLLFLSLLECLLHFDNGVTIQLVTNEDADDGN